MWLQLSQVLKKSTEGNGRKPAKNTRGSGFTREALRVSLHLHMSTVSENPLLSFEVQVES